MPADGYSNLNESLSQRDEILKNTANDYEKYVKVNLSKEVSEYI